MAKAKSRITSRVELITPAKAKKMLESDRSNRPLKKRYMEDVALQMMKGLWTVAQPISFDTNGNLLDGQHRLEAVIIAEKAIKFLIVEGLDPKTFGVFDQGKIRTASDLHSLMGGANSGRACSIASSMILRAVTGGGKSSLRREGVAKFALENGELIKHVLDHLAAIKYMKAGELGAFANAYLKWGNKITPMMERIRDNLFQSRDDPMNTLTKWMIKHHTKERASKLHAPRYLCYSAAVLAIKAAKSSRKLTILKPKGQDF